MTRIQKLSTTRTSPVSRGLVAIGLAALLGIAACGSDEKESSSDQKTDTSEQSASTDSGSDTDSDITSDSVEVTAATVTGSDISLPAGVTLPAGVSIPDVSADCLAFTQLFAQALTGTASDLGSADEAIEELKAKAPDDLADDFDEVAKVFAKLVELSEKNSGNPTAVYSDPELLAFFSDPDFTAAAQRVEVWLSTECGTEG